MRIVPCSPQPHCDSSGRYWGPDGREGGRLTPRHIAALIGLAVATWLVLAVGGIGTPPGKSGGREATQLTLAVAEAEGARDAALAADFAGRARARSHGALQIEVTVVPASDEASPSVALDRVRAAHADLAFAPSEAFSAIGVRTLGALHVPFLIGTDEAAARATAARFSSRLLGGLPAASLEGVGLVPEALYRPFGFLKALVSPADFQGTTVRAPRTPAIRDLLRELGAKAVDLDATGSDTAVYPAFGLDLPGRKANDTFPVNAYTASNVALFPKVDVVVASTSVFNELSAGERRILREAASDVRTAAIAANVSQGAAKAFCKAGGSLVEATPLEQQALRQRASVIEAALARDPTTSSLVRDFRRLDGGRPRSCSSSSPKTLDEPEGNVGNAVRDRVMPPAGSFRAAFTASNLRAAGATRAEAALDTGVLTLTFSGAVNNRLFALQWQDPDRAPCRGRVFWPNGLVELDWYPGTPCSGYAGFHWRRSDGDVRITASAADADPRWSRIFAPGTWKRVDCAAFRTENGIEPGRTRPCPGGAERLALAKTGRDAPSISPDGEQLVLETSLPGIDGIVIGKRDGSDLRWLEYVRHGGPWRVDDLWPRYSPDGAWIAFLRARSREGKPWGTGGLAIFVVRPDGSSLHRVTPFTRWEGLQRPTRLPPRDSSPYAIAVANSGIAWVSADNR